jgi:hypothetical protein
MNRAASTSTSGTGRSSRSATTLAAPERVPVRAKDTPLTAVRVPVPTTVTLVDGVQVPASAGDWLLARGAHTYRVLTPDQLATEFERVVPGQLTLTPADCQAIEAVVGLGTTDTVAKLLAAIARLASVKIGDIRIPFTPGQLSELQYRAQKRGRTVEAEMRAVVSRIEDELFYKGG